MPRERASVSEGKRADGKQAGAPYAARNDDGRIAWLNHQSKKPGRFRGRAFVVRFDRARLRGGRRLPCGLLLRGDGLVLADLRELLLDLLGEDVLGRALLT